MDNKNKMIDKIIKIPILADFNAQDEDGAIRMFDNLLSALDGKKINFLPKLNEEILLTDGDVEVKAVLKLRDQILVAIPIGKFKDVDNASDYHVSKTKF